MKYNKDNVIYIDFIFKRKKITSEGKTTRSKTADEKKVWRQFNPHMTEEELNKITVDIK